MTFTPSPPDAKVFKDLGLLAELPGRWVGHGFNLIARPDRQNNNPVFSGTQFHQGNAGFQPDRR
jgi:hypothetical protein